LKSDLKDSLERQRLAKLLESGLGNIAGYILPLKWRYTPGSEGWQSGVWTFRRGRLYLLPGTSPMGFRLPLDSLPWIDPAERGRAGRGPLPDRTPASARSASEISGAEPTGPSHRQ